MAGTDTSHLRGQRGQVSGPALGIALVVAALYYGGVAAHNGLHWAACKVHLIHRASCQPPPPPPQAP